jgi:hypothetical protein
MHACCIACRASRAGGRWGWCVLFTLAAMSPRRSFTCDSFSDGAGGSPPRLHTPPRGHARRRASLHVTPTAS